MADQAHHDVDSFRYSTFEFSDRTGVFTPEKVFSAPDLDALDKGAGPCRVAVLGGGAAGLTAADELASRDHVVTLFEQQPFFGGRIRTHRFADGTYGELGAMRIPYAHACVRRYVDLLGLSIRPFIADNPAGWLLFRDSENTGPVRRRDWAVIADRYDLPDEWRQPPGNIIGQITEHAKRRLGLVADSQAAALTWELLGNNISDPALSAWSHRSVHTLVHEFLTDMDNPFRLSDEQAHAVWQYAGRGSGQLWVQQMSVPYWLIQGGMLELDDSSPKYEIVNGTSTLVDSFVDRHAKLQIQAVLDATVMSLRLHEEGVTVGWTVNDKYEKAEFDYVVCTLPAMPTANLDVSPPLSPAKRDALTGLSYYPVSKSLLHVSKRVWETEDRIFGGTSTTDLDNQQCWYPSDNARPDTGPTVGLMEKAYVAINDEVSRGPGVMIGGYMWGDNAKRFAGLTENERTESVVSDVRRLHPSIDDYLEDVVHLPWANQQSPGGGGFGLFNPGDHGYQRDLVEPLWAAERPRVFFAGEHVGILQGWIQGAVQSALTAVAHVLQDIAA